jgi:glycine dehydrogenase subunit 1
MLAKESVYPYMPGSVPAVKKKLFKALGISSVEELLQEIPEDLRYRGKMDIPEAIMAEADLKRHVEGILAKNTSCADTISFLGAGCCYHYVPAICDEINSRSEFLTAYVGDTYSDHGKVQAIFEFCSMMAELLDVEVVSYTNYDGGQAAASALRMALRITGRRQILLPRTINPEILAQVRDYTKGIADIVLVDYEVSSGLLDLEDLKKKISADTAAVYFENPGYLGYIEDQGQAIADIAHAQDALCVVAVDPISLGLLESPINYGADILCGDIQPLGMHMHYGGGCAGFLATRDEEKYISEYPTYLYGITTTGRKGEYGWGRALNYRTSHGSREKGNEYFGTETGLWAITAAVYLALMGPRGMEEVGETLIYRSNYAKKQLSALGGVRTDLFAAKNFKEFVVNFDGTGKSVASINASLLKHGIFGGKDLSRDFPNLGQSALFCITEMISQEDIHKLVGALEEILAG